MCLSKGDGFSEPFGRKVAAGLVRNCLMRVLIKMRNSPGKLVMVGLWYARELESKSSVANFGLRSFLHPLVLANLEEQCFSPSFNNVVFS